MVSIEATNYMQVMNVTGVFGFKLLPAIEIAIPRGNPIDDVDTEFYKENSLTPASGRRGGVGGAFAVQILTNKTHAYVEQGTQLYTGTNSGLNVKAEELIFNLNFAQAGSSSGKIAIGGTFTYFGQTSDTLAVVQAGSEITGGRVDVYAGNLETTVNWAGGVAQSKSIGAGIAIAVNDIDRTTEAIIGEGSDQAGHGSTTGWLAEPKIEVTGPVTARALVMGGVYAFTVAGAVANASGQRDNPAPAGTQGKNDPLDGFSLPHLFNQTQPGRAGTSAAIAAAVSVNLVDDTTQASLSDYAVSADAVDVKARNEASIVAATGGLAFSKTRRGRQRGRPGRRLLLQRRRRRHGRLDPRRDARSQRLRPRAGGRRDRREAPVGHRRHVGNVWTLAAGGGGAVAAGGDADSKRARSRSRWPARSP